MKDLVIQELNKRNLTAKELAEIIHVAPSNISKFLNKKVETSFCTVLSIIRELFPADEFHLITKYAPKIFKKPENIKSVFLYAWKNCLEELLIGTVEQAKKTKNALLQEFVIVYEYVDKRLCNELTDDFYHFYLENRFQFEESQLIMDTLFAYFLLETMPNRYRFLNHLLPSMEQRVVCIQNDFLRNCVLSWIFDLYSLGNLFQFNLEKSREYALKNLEVSQFFSCNKASAYKVLCMSYLYEDHNKSAAYFYECLEEISKNPTLSNLTSFEIKNKLFIQNLLGLKELPITDEFPLEKAHYFIRNGRHEEAILILNTLEETPLSNYYKGLCLSGASGVEFLYKSLITYERMGNRFYAQLAKNELLKRGHKWLDFN